MFDEHDCERLRGTAIRGRLAFALVCFERALIHFGLLTADLTAFLEVFWGIAETHELVKAEQEWRSLPAAEILSAFEDGTAFPEAFRGWPEVLVRLQDAVRWIGTGEMYGRITGYGQESYDLVLLMVELCEQHGIEPPAFAPFARLAFAEEHGWGRAVARSFFETPA